MVGQPWDVPHRAAGSSEPVVNPDKVAFIVVALFPRILGNYSTKHAENFQFYLKRTQ